MVPLLVVDPRQLTLILAVQVAVAPVRFSRPDIHQALPVLVDKATQVVEAIVAIVVLTLKSAAAVVVPAEWVEPMHLLAAAVVPALPMISQEPRSRAPAAVVVVNVYQVRLVQVAQEVAAMAVQLLVALQARSTPVVAVAVAVPVPPMASITQAVQVVLV